jgi:hypothetical protein
LKQAHSLLGCTERHFEHAGTPGLERRSVDTAEIGQRAMRKGNVLHGGRHMILAPSFRANGVLRSYTHNGAFFLLFFSEVSGGMSYFLFLLLLSSATTPLLIARERRALTLNTKLGSSSC